MGSALGALAAGGVLGAAGITLARAGTGLKRSMGAKAERHFANTDPDSPHDRLSAGKIARRYLSRDAAQRSPRGPVPLAHDAQPETPGDLAVTWYGHSSVLIEVDGYRVLADPVWGDRVSPSPTIGPIRLHPVPVALSALPAVDAVVISHDHYDHLDMPTIEALAVLQETVFVVPIGVGGHLRSWGVPAARVIELDWGQCHTLTGPGGDELKVVCTEARHFSGRGLTRNSTQWASWSLVGPRRRVFFGGDTGFTERFKLVGDQFGPFDLTLLPIGAYDPLWPDVHVTPEEAVAIHTMIAAPGATLVPIHWATFNLAFHDWAEPVQRLLTAAADARVPVAAPRPGARMVLTEPDGDGGPEPWWDALT